MDDAAETKQQFPTGNGAGGGTTERRFVDRVAAAVVSCRLVRQPLSLLLISLTGFDDFVRISGAAEALRLTQFLEKSLRAGCEPNDWLTPISEICFALLLENRNRSRATTLARELVNDFERHTELHPTEVACRLSLGLAALEMPPKDFQAVKLIDAAQLCLSAAQHSGGNALKSIEL